MITVRFATGFSIQYNDANYVVSHESGITDLYEKKDGTWVARVPTAACVIEVRKPCRLYSAIANPDLVGDFLTALENDQQRRAMSTHSLAKIKSILGNSFNGRSRAWR